MANANNVLALHSGVDNDHKPGGVRAPGGIHHVSPKHLARYIDEFAFRLNEGNVARHTLQRLDSFVDAVVGKRITYAEVTA